MLMKEVKTFCLCDLIQFLKAEQADDTPDQDNISDLSILLCHSYKMRPKQDTINCSHRTTGTFLFVRNSLAISMSSKSTGHPQYSSHLVLNLSE